VGDHLGVEAVDGVVDTADEAGFGVAAGVAHAAEQGEPEAGDLRPVPGEDVRRFGAEALQRASQTAHLTCDEGFDVQVGRGPVEPADKPLHPGEGVPLFGRRDLDGRTQLARAQVRAESEDAGGVPSMRSSASSFPSWQSWSATGPRDARGDPYRARRSAGREADPQMHGRT
jgi:hypothetical protein